MAQIELKKAAKSFTIRRKAGLIRREKQIVTAVDGISLVIEAGSTVGYIGPNGAGKSTSIKMLTGILVPSSGEISVLDMTPHRRRIELTRRIGVVFGQRSQLWWDLPLLDSFDLLHHVYRTDRQRHLHNLAVFTRLLELAPFLQAPVRQLSLGQRMRGELTAALLHDPEILFLDEPTIGLDVVSKFAVRDFLAALNAERGTTIVLTTHDLADVEHLCERLVIIDHGRVIHDGSLIQFRRSYGNERTVVVDLEEPCDSLEIPYVQVIENDGHRQRLRFSREETSAAIVIREVVAQARVVDVLVEDPPIEDLVRDVYLNDQ